ncbi:MAG: peptide-N-glycosidase F-related protein [Myxococcota bacterium]|nr:peptide-N-glycosidase F-related protein [Myxococcota bacterium]
MGWSLLSRIAFAVAFLCLVACTSDNAGSDGQTVIISADASVEIDGSIAVRDASMADVEGMDDPSADAGGVDASVLTPDAMSSRQDVCETLGFAKRSFNPDGAATFEFGDAAGGFTANTLTGSWSLADEWSGCDSYVFLTYFPDIRANSDGSLWVGDGLWASRIAELFEAGPRNVHYFFVSYEDDPSAIAERMEAQRQRLESELVNRLADEADRAYWRSRFHFVTDRVTVIDGSVGAFFRDYMRFLFTPSSVVDLGNRGRAQPPLPFAFAIDRHQKWDSVGSLSPVVGQPSVWGMAAYAGHFFNHKAELETRLEESNATVVTILDDMVTARHHVKTVTLPDADTMASFDRFEIDIQVTCPHRNVFACSEWDRNARIQYCLDPECAEQREIVRWITPYWRRGHRRWVIDASPFLAYLRTGGAHTFKIEMGPTWERATERAARFDLRFSSIGGPKAIGAQRLYRGGGFNADYNMNHGPVEVSLPPDATRAELVVILSGHGQNGDANCSEWCDHRHVFSVNGNALEEIRSELQIGRLRGCAEESRSGVPPGQYGNWAVARAYWCPGWPVDAMRFDVTDLLNGDETQLVTYSANMAGGDPAGGNIDLSVYMVWYAD